MFSLLIFGLILSYAVWSLITLRLNYGRASTMGIPIICIPVDPLSVPWQILENHVWYLIDLLHIPIPAMWRRVLHRGWYFHDKAAMSTEFGPIYALVSPANINVQLCDSEAINSVITSKVEFYRPYEPYRILNVFGPSISSANPANWARHRKVLATPFMNESIMKDVWKESIRQTRQMINIWTSGDGWISSVEKDTRTVSLNVLAAIGFRQTFDFRSSLGRATEENGSFSYRDALQIILDNIMLTLLVPQKLLGFSLLPSWMHRVKKAGDDFQRHMERMLDNELIALSRGEKDNGGLMPSFVRALDANQKDSRKGMTVEEIYGNTFVINFAGHDTTANTLAYAVLHLVAHPEIQEWVAEEVRTVAGDLEDHAEWDYASLYPRLLRCRAVMLETLRLFPSIMSIPRWSHDHIPQPLKVGAKTIIIPPHTGFNLNTMATHTYPEYWPEPLSWKPSRWIQSSEILVPKRDTYYPWSDGPQNCPGIKFSQVEFVAFLATLMRQHRVYGVKNEGETDAELRNRVLEVIEDSEAIMLLKMKAPNRIKVRCERAK